MTLTSLARTWYGRADDLAPFAPAAAEAFRRAAQELDVALREAGDELLTLEQASASSGYSPDHLSRQLREGRIPNAGTKHRPRIRRADVPKKPGVLRERADESHHSARRRVVASDEERQ